MLANILVSDEGELVDEDGNCIVLRGVNLDPTVKIPSSPFEPTYRSHDDLAQYLEQAPAVSFIGHPISLTDVKEHITRLRSLGYNCIRVPFTWESIEHQGPGQYDVDYMDYMIEVFRQIKEVGGMYIYLDPHQDVWSRFCGGSGAPLWTLYCAGFDPLFFKETEASVLHSHFDNLQNPGSYPKMLWPTNYYRLACETMFTLFFAGETFAPKCRLNGVNIQQYLQDKFINCVMTFIGRIKVTAPELLEHNCIIGLETMNEPSSGYLRDKDLGSISKERNLKRGTCPTAFQSFMLGEGYETLVDEYDITLFGPSKVGTKKINPEGKKCWLSEEGRKEIDAKYGWDRGTEWLAGQCIWRLHGAWEISNDGPRLIKSNYFVRAERTESASSDYNYFMNEHFMSYYKKYREELRRMDENLFLFMQPPVFQPPPDLKAHNLLDKRTIYACHFYDGLSLMFKTWNRKFNVDTLGIVRGRYMSPILSIVLGEQNIRKSIRKQLREMKCEVKNSLHLPVFFTEIGMPFDMDDKKAYKTKDFSSQTSALDALQYALEGENLSYSLWCYCSKNSHKWGDLWNNEDFSIWSQDDKTGSGNSAQDADSSDFLPLVSNDELKMQPCIKSDLLDFDGFRALDAILRPFPVKIHGKFLDSEFDLTSKVYRLEILGKTDSDRKPNAASYIFLPRKHFPLKQISIQASSGRFSFDPDYQVLKWFHDPGSQYITVSVVQDDRGSPRNGSPECVIC